MKPLYITMQEFGVYRKKQTISFENFKDCNIFLITGPTGSGKTTILDAICFSLYCRATGGIRTWAEMRSTSAKKPSPTIVDYVFMLKDKKYRFKRLLKIHTVRGSGREEVRYESSCYIEKNDEWEPIITSGENKVTEYAKELIGLDCDQFSKVIILPQGEFKDLILSSTNEKEKIFQSLFMTDKWGKIAETASTLTRETAAKLQQYETQKKALLSNFEVNSIEELLKLRSEIKINYENSINRLETLEKEQSELSEKIDLLTKINESRKQLKERQESYNNALKSFEDASILLNKANTQYKTIQQLENENEQLKDKANSLLKLSDIYKNLDDITVKISDTDIKIKNSKNIEKDLSERIVENEVSIKKGESYIYNTYLKINELQKLMPKRENLKNIINEYERLNKLKKDIEIYKEQYTKHHKKVEMAKKTVDSLKRNLDALLKSLELNAAYSLALKLKDGEMCPVCGSKDHPSPMKAPSNCLVTSKDDIDTLKRTINKEESNLLNIQEQYNESCTLYKSKLQEYNDQEKLCNNFNSNKESAENDIANINSQINSIEYEQKRLPAYERRLESLKKEKASLSEQSTKLIAELARLNQDLKNLKNEESKLKTELQKFNISADQAKRELSTINSKIVDNKNRTLSIRKNHTEAVGNAERAKANLDNSEKLLNDEKAKNEALELKINFSDYNLDKLEISKSEKERLTKEQTQKIGEQKQQFQHINSVYENLTLLEKDLKKSSDRYSGMARISSLMNGNNPLKTPIKIFVLGMALDNVLSFANIYLSKLSNQRYSLSRVKEKIVSRGYNGLDLEVFDAHLGSARPVGTLSGGELFLASLALAFGLSDAVQSYCGNVRIDSIFIDEGFGSLDQSTLNTVMLSLNQIQQKGRLIGIISHVEELKQLIPNHLSGTPK